MSSCLERNVLSGTNMDIYISLHLQWMGDGWIDREDDDEKEEGMSHACNLHTKEKKK